MSTVDLIQKILLIVQAAVVICAALFAVLKFKIFRLWSENVRSEMECNAQRTVTGDIVFEAKYKIFNTGDRPLRVNHVVLKLCHAKETSGSHLIPDLENLLVSPTVIAADKGQAGSNDHFKPIGKLGIINKGAYSTFTLRCRLKELPDVVFVAAEFSWRDGIRIFNRMYVNAVNEMSSRSPFEQRSAASA